MAHFLKSVGIACGEYCLVVGLGLNRKLDGFKGGVGKVGQKAQVSKDTVGTFVDMGRND